MTKLNYSDANSLLTSEFEEMQAAFDNDLDEYDDGDVNSCYSFYGYEFRPFILRQLLEKKPATLKKIFDFIERLFVNGDEDLKNMIGVEICEGLYYDNVCVDFKDTLLKYCGKETLQSFVDCFEEDEKAEWERHKLAIAA